MYKMFIFEVPICPLSLHDSAISFFSIDCFVFPLNLEQFLLVNLGDLEKPEGNSFFYSVQILQSFGVFDWSGK